MYSNSQLLWIELNYFSIQLAQGLQKDLVSLTAIDFVPMKSCACVAPLPSAGMLTC